MSSSNQTAGLAIQREVAALFRKEGWSVRKHDSGPDLTIRKGNKAYAVEVKRSSEGRTDRLVPLMAQAILQAQSYAKSLAKVEPLAIVAAPHIPPRVAHQLRKFASAHAPDIAVGIIDSRGFRDFSESDMDSLNERALLPAAHEPALGPKVVDLFSDLNQRLIKVLLAPYLNNTGLLNAQPAHYGNYSELAKAASVSGMTAFRFLRQLRVEGFLHESSSVIRLVRLDDLFHRWQSVAAVPTSEIGVRWLLPGDGRVQMERAMKPLGNEVCLGLFAAANALHLGVVRGVPTHLYVRKPAVAAISKMHLIKAPHAAAVEVIVKIPSAPESVFRGAVSLDGVRSADVLQVWLDVHEQPSRGREQAEIIRKRIIEPMIKRAKSGK
jgi:hypothetical protein